MAVVAIIPSASESTAATVTGMFLVRYRIANLRSRRTWSPPGLYMICSSAVIQVVPLPRATWRAAGGAGYLRPAHSGPPLARNLNPSYPVPTPCR